MHLRDRTHWIFDMDGTLTVPMHDFAWLHRTLDVPEGDDILATIVAKLDAAGELDNTFIAYTADNGYHTGAFGFVYDKRQPWETDTHLPLLIRGPGIKAGISTAAPVSMPARATAGGTTWISRGSKGVGMM